MCLTVKKYKKESNAKRALKTLRPKVADYDILVFKSLRPNGRSPYQNYPYICGKKVKSRLNIKVKWGEIIVEEGLHAYRLKKDANYYSFSNDQVFPAIIPKGSKYFIGQDKDIVSNQLIVYEDLKTLSEKRGQTKTPFLSFT